MKKLLLIACVIAGIAVASCDTPKETTESVGGSTDSAKVSTDTTMRDTSSHPVDTTRKP